ncbi:hypothetical protein PQ462_18485 [Flavobacterium sp. KACC 22758]|nr:hypothetical protein [Flavobacterium sp. KACC 22758]WDF58702.1 hypothetical protein PQ462_18485 [Flavobacterium sp. KACC 22758]
MIYIAATDFNPLNKKINLIEEFRRNVTHDTANKMFRSYGSLLLIHL